MTTTPTRIELTDPRVTQLARARQQLAHNGMLHPTWDELTDAEREGSLPYARSYLEAAVLAGLVPGAAATTPLTDQQLADTCGTCHSRDFKRCPACLGTGIKPNPLAWMRFWQLLDEMEPARLRYRRALRRAEATSTDSPEFDAARVKGDAALAEIEQLMRGWIAANPAADDPRNAELTRRRTDDLSVRGALAPADGPRHVPMALGDSVTPAVEWLIAELGRVRAELATTQAELGREVRQHGQTIKERDDATDMADRLAAAIAPESVIGEHSGMNCPWTNALEYASEQAVRAAQPSV